MLSKIRILLIIVIISIPMILMSVALPKPVLYFSFEKTFSPEIINTRFFFSPNPKFIGKVDLVNKDGDYSLYFDGKSFIKYKATNLLDYKNFTVSMWIIPKYISPYNSSDWDNMTTLFSVRTYLPNDFPEWALTLYRSKGETYALVFYISKNDQIIGWHFNIQKDLLDSKWHNLILIKTPNIMKFYVDGELVDTVNLKVSEKFENLIRSDYFCLGGSRRNALNSKFKGYMDDVAVWDIVLNNEQVKNIFTYGGIGKEVSKSQGFDLEKAKAILREAYNEGKISYEQLKRALNEITSGIPSKLLLDFINGIVSADDFAILY